MIFGSLFSGIEAASVAWAPLGWRPAFFSEIAKFPSAVLAHHYADIPNYGDILEYRHWPDAELDVLCGGPPCQSDSVAGKRGGMADPRGALKRTYLDVVERYGPRWVLFEGVPGVRSVDEGRAFGALVGGLAELGYFGAWTSLDAQYRGVAQRRERVFFVGCARGWHGAAAVLFDAASLRGDPAPRREAGKNPSGTLSASAARRGADEGERGTLTVGALTAACGPRGHGGSGLATDKGADAGHILAYGGNNTSGPIDVATACNAHGGSGRMDFESETFLAHALTASGFDASGFDASEDGTGRGTPLVPVTYDLQQITSRECRSTPSPGDPCGALTNPARVVTVNARQDPDVNVDVDVDVVGPLDTDGGSYAIQAGALRENPNSGPDGVGVQRGVAYTIEARAEVQAVAHRYGVRRLTPRECERLQGFPDDYTLIPYRGKLAADGPRYAALGNSWAVPVVRWIGERIAMVDAAIEGREARAA